MGYAMKTRRTFNPREFRVGTAGWFTVLRADSFMLGSLTGRSKRAVRQNDGQEPMTAPSMQLITDDLSLKRTALIVLVAMTMAAVLLWCIMHP